VRPSFNTERLAILFIVPFFEEAWGYGGIPRACALLAHGLAARGHDVTVCTTDARDARSRLPPGRRAASGLEVRVFRNLSNHAAYHWQLFLPIGLDCFLGRQVARFDVAHIHGVRHLLGVAAARRLARARVPFVVQPHGTAPRIERRRALKWLFDALFGNSLDRAGRVIAVSVAERSWLERLGTGRSRLALLPNPVEEPPAAARAGGDAWRRALGLHGAQLIVFLGKITPRKRVDVLVHAFALLARARPELALVIAGNEMGAGVDLRALAARLGLAARVHFTGQVDGARRFEVLAAADLVAYPSEHEVFGLVPLEALSCGTPVLVSDDCGAGEAIAQIGGGRAVAVAGPDAIAAALGAMLDDLPAWRAAAARAPANVAAHHGRDAVALKLEHIYHELLDRRPCPPAAA
jgi:glycosyltransferase involved in cell wall biosynthesis